MTRSNRSFNGPALLARGARRGFVLVAALLAMVLIAALAASVLFATAEATRAGSAGVIRERALIASESALVTAISAGMDLPAQTGVRGTTSHRVDADGWQVIVYITRLDSATYWVLAEANDLIAGTGTRKRVGLFVKAVHQDGHLVTVDRVSELGWAEVF